MNITQKTITIRCYAREVDGQWVGVCLNFDLAAQADTFDEVAAKLRAQVDEYLFDACAGQDRKHAQQLMSRRAPLKEWLWYGWIGVCITFSELVNAGRDHIRSWHYADTPPVSC